MGEGITLIVGAAASLDFGLPTGEQLLADIASDCLLYRDHNNSLCGDPQLYEVAIRLAQEFDPGDDIEKVAFGTLRLIRSGMALAPSVDNFLHTHQSNGYLVKLGKVLIVRAILNAERRSTLFFGDGKVDFARDVGEGRNKLRQSWLAQLFRILVAERTFQQFVVALSRVRMIVFNYDRCVEYFIVEAARIYFRLNDVQAAQVMSAICIVHPYGVVGDLYDANGDSRFGQMGSFDEQMRSGGSIRTFTEGARNDDVTAKIHAFLESRSLTCFLGFGFLPLNLDLLSSQGPYAAKRVIGTAFRVSAENLVEIEGVLKEYFIKGRREAHGIIVVSSHHLVLDNITCAMLLESHSGPIAKEL
jgi:hypothetical protein